MSPKDRFSEIVATRISEAEGMIGHKFIKLHSLIAEKGSHAEAACHLLAPRSSGKFSYGFKLLAEADLLSLSIEQAALEFEHTGLFTGEQLSNARARLALGRMLAASLKAAGGAHVISAADEGGAYDGL
jgi:hypothetical protein